MPSCVAYDCKNRTGRHKKAKSGISYHRFPIDQERRNAWMKAVRRENWIPNRHSVLCSEHFVKTDFYRTSFGHIRLISTAIPTIFKNFPLCRQKAHFDANQYERKIPNKLKPNAVPTLFSQTTKLQCWNSSKVSTEKEGPFKLINLDHAYARKDFLQSVLPLSSDLDKYELDTKNKVCNNESEIVEDLKFQNGDEMIEDKDKFHSVDEKHSSEHQYKPKVVGNIPNNSNLEQTRISNDEYIDMYNTKISQNVPNTKDVNSTNNGLEWQNCIYSTEVNFQSYENDTDINSISDSETETDLDAFTPEITKGYDDDDSNVKYDHKLNLQCKVICERLNVLREKKQFRKLVNMEKQQSKHEGLKNVKDISTRMKRDDSDNNGKKNFIHLFQNNVFPLPEKDKNLTSKRNHLRTENGKGSRKYRDEIYDGITIPEDGNIYICGLCNAKFFCLTKLTAHRCIAKESYFKCKFCEKEFVWNLTLKYHMKIHGGKKHIRCNFCAKRGFTMKNFSKKNDVLQNLRRKILKLCLKRLWIKDINALNSQLLINKDKYIEENVSEKSFTSGSNHLKAHAEDRTFQCEICNRHFRQRSHLSQHKLYHSNERLHKCQFCEKTFTRKKELVRHMNCHPDARQYQCKICQKNFNKKSLLSAHEKSHFDGNSYQCNVCMKTFKQLSNLNCHKRSHSEERPFECEVCKKNFKSQLNLTYHKLRHSLERPYECEFCEKKFKGKMHLMRHKRSHSVFKPFQCNLCKKNFSSMSNLTTHQVDHLIERPFQCEFCKKRYKQKLHLKRHQKRSHLNEKTKIAEFCDVCGKEKTCLSDHEKCHYDTREYRCKVCGECFKKLSLLKEHNNKCHSSKNSYQCNLCQKSYKKKCHLVRHIRFHSNKKNFECEICGRHFKCLPNLNSHKRCHKKENHYQCTLCKMGFRTLSDLEQHVKIHSEEESYRHESNNELYRHENKDESYRHENEDESYRHENEDESYRHENEDESYRHENEDGSYRHENEDGSYQHEHYTESFNDDNFFGSNNPNSQSEVEQFQCSYCEENFEDLLLLLEHENSHFEIASDKKAQQKRSHKKPKIRTRQKLHQCEHCDKSFRFKMHLVRHLRYHLRENLFHCMLCRKTFKSMSSLIDHQSVHIG